MPTGLAIRGEADFLVGSREFPKGARVRTIAGTHAYRCGGVETMVRSDGNIWLRVLMWLC